MDYRPLGRTGLKVAPLCMGTMTFGWQADEETAFAILDAYVEAGGNFIDTANVYGGGRSEEIVGRWLKARGNRDAIILATKVGMKVGEGPNDYGGSRRHILAALEASLRRLGVDYIDLYQTHFYDYDTPVEETLRALDDAVRAGKVRYLGASNHRAWELMQALWTADKLGTARYDCLQPHYNLVHREEFERELRSVCLTYGLGVIPFFPLASGFLSGKYQRDSLPDSQRAAGVQRRYYNEASWRALDALLEVAREAGATPAATAVAWLLHQPAVTAPILGARTVEQVRDTLNAVAVRLSPEQLQRLDAASAWTDVVTRPPSFAPRRG
ncbi:MAG: aldo/keto reductase [Dehalococcoidia bacterium]|nr:aldo/keto reductase [Dehalococcoidia bacterium]